MSGNAKITRSSGDVFVDLGMTAEDGREVVRRKMAEHKAREVMEAINRDKRLDTLCHVEAVMREHIAQALAESRDEGHREGMMRAAEIARDEIVEIYEDSPDIDIECNNLVRRIASDIEAEVSPHPRLSSQADAEPGAAGANATAASFSGRE